MKDAAMADSPGLPFLRTDLFAIPTSSVETPYLIGSKCKLCGRVFFPKRTICIDCKNADNSTMEQIHLSPDGKLHSGIIVQVAPEGFKAPYAMGYIDLPEGVRIWAQLEVEGITDKDLIPGADVHMVLGKIREDEKGQAVVAYKFKLR
jgi:uncharacterized OB-fold protein